MTHFISPERRELIEHARRVNKTLSLFVLTLQERPHISAESQFNIAAGLDALADAIRKRVSEQATDSVGKALTDDAPTPLSSSGPTIHLAATTAGRGVPIDPNK